MNSSAFHTSVTAFAGLLDAITSNNVNKTGSSWQNRTCWSEHSCKVDDYASYYRFFFLGSQQKGEQHLPAEETRSIIGCSETVAKHRLELQELHPRME